MGSSQSRTAGQPESLPDRQRSLLRTSEQASSSSTQQPIHLTPHSQSRDATTTSPTHQPNRRRPRPADSLSTQSSSLSASGRQSPPGPTGHDESGPSRSGSVSPFIDENNPSKSSKLNGKGKEKERVPNGGEDARGPTAPEMQRSKSSLMSIFKGGKQKSGREKKRRRLDDEVESEDIMGMDTQQGDQTLAKTAEQADMEFGHIARHTSAGPPQTGLPPTSLEPMSSPTTSASSATPSAISKPAASFLSSGTRATEPPKAMFAEDVDMDAEERSVETPIMKEGEGRTHGEPSVINPTHPEMDGERNDVLSVMLGAPITVASSSIPKPHESKEEISSVPGFENTPTDVIVEDRSRALSPDIIPLTTSDPLISDRLSALSAIRDVLGDDVLRSLPSVRTARASLELERRVSRTSLRRVAVGDEGEGDGRAVLPAGVEIPADARSLLQELEEKNGPQAEQEDVVEAADAVMAVDDDLPPPSPLAVATETTYEPFSAPLIPAHPPVPSTLLTPASPTFGHPASHRPSLATIGPAAGSERTASRHSSNLSLSSRNRERDGQLGRVTSRLSGWLGLNNAEGSGSGSTSNNDTAWSSGPSVRRARSAEDFVEPSLRASTRVSPLNSPVPEEPPAAAETEDPSRARIRPGATLIIQGFVQTSMPTAGVRRNESDASRPNSVHGERNLGEQSALTSEMSSGIGNGEGEINATNARSTLRRRQSAGDSAGRPRRDGLFGRNRATAAPPPPPAFAQQAEMLGGLLSVATAATAASLLTPPGQASPLARSNERAAGTARSALNNIRDRLRHGASSNRSNISDTMDDSLREYMRHAMDPNRTWSGDAAQEAPQGGYVAGPDGPVPASEHPAPPPAARSRLRSLLPNTDSDAFETFLDNMQVDLSRQLREYVGEILPAAPSGSTSTTATGGETVGTADASEPMDVDPASVPLPADEDEMEVDAALEGESPAITLTEPYVLGHSRPGTPHQEPTSTSNAPAATPGAAHGARSTSHAESSTDPHTESSRRRFNFFRMFQFPSREQEPANGQPVTAENPMQNLVPVLIIGVRSLNRDIATMTSGDAANSPFMFGDEEDEAEEAAGNGMSGAGEPSVLRDTSAGNTLAGLDTSSEVDTASVTASPGDDGSDHPTRPGGWGSRALRALGRHRRNDESERRTRSSLFSGSAAATPASAIPADQDAADPSVRNYVLWVFGGHYPANHPILTIPQLFTGMGDLTHDDLWALAEAMGQVKPPTATKDDIRKSGLEEIKGDKIGLAVQHGKVLENCLERCLICLGDYEAEEDCRIMSCKHAFHSPCIDHWLEVGRNSCPACRQAGVETTSTPAGTQAAPAAATTSPITTPT